MLVGIACMAIKVLSGLIICEVDCSRMTMTTLGFFPNQSFIIEMLILPLNDMGQKRLTLRSIKWNHQYMANERYTYKTQQ